MRYTAHQLAKKLLDGPDVPVFFKALEIPTDAEVRSCTAHDDCVLLGEESEGE